MLPQDHLAQADSDTVSWVTVNIFQERVLSPVLSVGDEAQGICLTSGRGGAVSSGAVMHSGAAAAFGCRGGNPADVSAQMRMTPRGRQSSGARALTVHPSLKMTCL